MSTSNLAESFRIWLDVFLGTLESTTAYTQFSAKCYKELRQEGVPSGEAALMATELLKIHIEQWFQTRRRNDADEVNLKILQNFISQQGQ